MKTLYFILVLLVSLTSALVAQIPPDTLWTKTFGGDFWLVKTDENGNEEWNQTYGGSNSDNANSVQQTTDGGYIIAGFTYSYGAGESDFWLIKTDENGNVEWDQTYGGSDYDFANSVQQTTDGGYIVAGSTGSIEVAFWLVKTDENGNEEWNQTYNVGFMSYAYSVQQTTDGGYIVAGETDSDFWLVKIDENGNGEWMQIYGGNESEWASSVQQTDFWLVKTDENGNEEWNQTYGGSNSDNANSVQQTTDGGYIVAGHISSWVSDDDFWLIKTDENGNVEWDQTYGGYDSDNANSVQQTTDGGYIVAGFTESYGSGSKDVWLLKFAPEGSPYNPPQNLFVTELGYATWEAPEGAAVFTDDFDSYTAGEYLCTQTTDWATWGNTPGGTDDCYVVDVQANSGANSIEITGASDIIHPFGDLTTGAWGVSFMMYIEPTYGGYFNLLHEFTEWRRLRTEWALEAYFGSTGSGYLHAGGTNAATFTHPVGGWFEIETLIDLDADWAEFYVDGVFVHAWQWSLQFNGTPGLCQLGAIDIFAAAPAGDTPLFYIDDFAHTITTTERDLTGFNVYLDDMVTSIATVGADVFEYQYTDLTNGQNYIAGVSAVYDEGESDIVE
jgi:hypothetical protein